MAENIETGADALVVDSKDHVATALKDLNAGETISIRIDTEVQQLKLLDDIPFGHKVSLMNLDNGSHIKKYGEVIGQASQAIQAGQHVHVHNVEGIRGRGDRAVKGETS